MPNTWDRDVHPIKTRKQKPTPIKICKNKRLGNDIVLQKLKEHVDAYDLVDKHQSRAKLFPSSVRER